MIEQPQNNWNKTKKKLEDLEKPIQEVQKRSFVEAKTFPSSSHIPLPPHQFRNCQPRPEHPLCIATHPPYPPMGNCKKKPCRDHHSATRQLDPRSCQTQGGLSVREDQRLCKPLRHSTLPAGSLCLQPFCVAWKGDVGEKKKKKKKRGVWNGEKNICVRWWKWACAQSVWSGRALRMWRHPGSRLVPVSVFVKWTNTLGETSTTDKSKPFPRRSVKHPWLARGWDI